MFPPAARPVLSQISANEIARANTTVATNQDQQSVNSTQLLLKTKDAAGVSTCVKAATNQANTATSNSSTGSNTTSNIASQQIKVDDPLPNGCADVVRDSDFVPVASVPQVIKSLLKKSYNQNASDTHPKHNRNVSFNQTVIVFCEETEALSPGDQYEPPLGYQDPLGYNAFEPPEDYCDHKTTAPNTSSQDCKEELPALSCKEDQVNNDDGAALIGCTDDCVTSAALTDEQLFGLLESESLLETFKLNCDDFSANDFHINRLNPNLSYLCNHAISDYDSDSESSSEAAKRKDDTCSVASVGNSIQVESGHRVFNDSKLSKGYERTKASEPDDDASKSNLVSSDCSSDWISKADSEVLTKVKPVPQKSLPARMKVSTVDSSHFKRQSNRKEDTDLKPNKLDISVSSQNSSKNEQQPNLHRVTTKHDDEGCSAMLIKQSTVEPLALPRPTVVTSDSVNLNQQAKVSNATANNKLNVDSVSQVNQIQSVAPTKPADHLIKNDSPNQSRETIPLSNKMCHSQPQGIGANQVQSQSGCHICKIIESNRSQHQQEQQINNSEPKTLPNRDDQLPKNVSIAPTHHVQPQPNHFQVIKPAVVNQPAAVFDQSCVSCREASLKQNTLQNSSQPRASGIGPAIRPVAYQLVYVVDQKGNRVSALSLARPGLSAPGALSQQPVVGQRILIAQNGRFPNPVPVAGQVINIPANQVVNSQWAKNFATLKSSPQQFTMVRPTQAHQVYVQPQQQGQFLHQAQPSTIRTPAHVTNLHAVPVGNLSFRQHTVYYLRQPLDTQRQSFDSIESNPRSFPDPHEIRRLDGLRGPTTTLNLSNRVDQNSLKAAGQNFEASNFQCSAEPTRKAYEPPKDEADDPTFGFSKRPSVKVVATCSSLTANETSTIFRPYAQASDVSVDQRGNQIASEISTTHRTATNKTGSLRPGSMIVLGCQTLDRRRVGQHYQVMKENIPSTSSMSNIHGTFATNPTDKVSTSTCNVSSLIQTKDNSNNSKNQESKQNQSDNFRSEGNTVILNNRVAPLASQGRQVSNLTELNINSLDQIRRSKPEQPEVAFSMNI